MTLADYAFAIYVARIGGASKYKLGDEKLRRHASESFRAAEQFQVVADELAAAVSRPPSLLEIDAIAGRVLAKNVTGDNGEYLDGQR